MFNEIDELLIEIDKFKNNIANSDMLINTIKSTSEELIKCEKGINDITKQYSDIKNKIDELSYQIESYKQDLSNYSISLNKKIHLNTIFNIIIILLLIFLNFK